MSLLLTDKTGKLISYFSGTVRLGNPTLCRAPYVRTIFSCSKENGEILPLKT
jgi:hypothetical protein